MFSLIVPVYKNEDSIQTLLDLLDQLTISLEQKLEVIFVIDASPDRSLELLRQSLPARKFRSKLIVHSRNFGSFSAIRTGLQEAEGEYFAVMSADLQEPISLIEEFFQKLVKFPYDLAVGVRSSRADPLISRFFSAIYWKLYCKFIQPNMPVGGIDVFACNRVLRDAILELREANSSLVGLLIWTGFRTVQVPYNRMARKHGKSAWKFSDKFRYLSNSIFAFSDLPIRVLTFSGALGIAVSVILGSIILVAKIFQLISIPGYAAISLNILFFGALNCFGIGLVGSYVWRALENTKGRPHAIVISRMEFHKKDSK